MFIKSYLADGAKLLDIRLNTRKEEAISVTKPINEFPGYKYEDGKNLYRGTDLGKGGYIISKPGMYGNVALLDVASLHPHSIVAMNCFGEYTGRFKELLDARIAIKHKDFTAAKKCWVESSPSIWMMSRRRPI